MGVLELVNNNIILIIALSVIILLANLNMNKKDRLNRLFIRLASLVLIALVLNTAGSFLDDSNATGLITANKIIHMAGFVLMPLIPYMWLLFILKKFELKFNKRFLIYPLFVNTILSILNYKFSLVFAVDDANKYSHGVLYIVPVALSCIYFLISFIILFSKRNMDGSRENIALILFSFIPVVGAVMQGFSEDMPVVWNYTGVALIIYYVYRRERTFKYDSLTGTWNRVAFEVLLNNNLRNNNTSFSLAYIDIDNFKLINDTYGHDEGDVALKTTASILNETFKSKGTVVRMGGDEFIIIIYSSRKYIVDKLIEQMRYNFSEYNRKTDKPYKIRFSCGYDKYDEKYKDVDTLIKHVDRLMYLDKNSKWQRGTGS